MKPYLIKAQLYCVLIFTGLFTIAQSDEPNLTPPSPAATAIQRVGIEATNPYTGGADVTIPLFELKLNELSVPITMKYSGIHGIKVQEIASWVGLGWTLSAGGAVSRTIRSLADDLEGGYFRTPNLSSADPVNIWLGSVDGEPDQFNYTAPGAGGTFFIKKDSSFLQVPLSDNRIAFEHSNNQFTKFTVTNTSGIIYTFETIESIWSHTFGSPYSSTDYKASTWYLTKMENANRTEEILFEYEEEQPNSYVESYTEDYFTSLTGTTHNPTYTLTRTKQLRLKKITGGIYEIDFIADIERCDMKDTNYLRQVLIKRSGTITKRYDFDYKYFTASGEVALTDPCNPLNSLNPNFPDGDHEKRLRLESITEYGSNNGSLPPYEFTYESSAFLPDRNSFARDHWGFYNGATSNTRLDPKQYIHLPDGVPYPDTDFFIFGDADRNPDLASTKAGVLTQIKFPTGGYTAFNYELNKVQDAEIESDLSAQSTSVLSTGLLTTPETLPINVNLIERPFTDVRVSMQGFVPTNQPTDPNYCGAKVEAFGPNGFYAISYFLPENYDVLYGATSTMLLPSGTYSIVVTADNLAGCSTGDYFINIDWDNQVPTPEKTVGGLRIASIENCNGPGDCVTRHYRYQKADGTSSGNLVVVPVYGYIIYISGIPTTWKRTIETNRPLLTTAGNHVGYSRTEVYTENDEESGKSVYEYTSPEFIKEIALIEVGSNGSGGEYYPKVPTTPRDWLRGRIKRNKSQSYANNMFNDLKTNEYTFEAHVVDVGLNDPIFGDPLINLPLIPVPDPETIHGIVLFCDRDSPDDPYICEVNLYSIATGKIDVVQQTTKTLEQGDEMTVNTAYSYLPFNRLLSSEETTYTTGRKHRTDYEYNVASASNLPASIFSAVNYDYDDLYDMYTDYNIITSYYEKTIENSDINNPTTLNQKLSLYEKSNRTIAMGQTINTYYLKEVHAAQDDGPLEKVIEYTYNGLGLPETYTTQDGRIRSFIWGSDYQLLMGGVSDAPMTTYQAVINGNVPGIYEATLYFYDDLGRIERIRDINGKETGYTYDEFGRLIQVHDQNGKVLKQIDYHFKTSN
ncbi:MAG: RHS repeat domain-containing protein [Cyclobacteriaceae bacterium]